MVARKPHARGRSKRPVESGRASAIEATLDTAIRRWWTGYSFPSDRSDRELLALGGDALERLLDCVDGSVRVHVEQDEMNYRDYGDWRAAGLCAFGKADPAGVLARVTDRGWDDERIGSYFGAVPEPCFLRFVIARLGNPNHLERVAAVNQLALHRNPRATEALLSALKDRVRFVRFCALEALGHAGDPGAVEPLRRFAKEVVASKRDVYLADAAREAINRIRP